ncbi:MAG TPA: hypothetical protein ENJ82_11510 [Bacteroidetes bacterium]|nr:hypothetical protein [Bacteroidota bacterium]
MLGFSGMLYHRSHILFMLVLLFANIPLGKAAEFPPCHANITDQISIVRQIIFSEELSDAQLDSIFMIQDRLTVLGKECNSGEYLPYIYNRLAGLYSFQNLYEPALDLVDVAASQAKRDENSYELLYSKFMYGYIAREKGQINKALEYFEELHEAALQANDLFWRTRSYSDIYYLYLKFYRSSRMMEKFKEVSLENIEIYRKLGQRADIFVSYLNLAEYGEDEHEAFVYYYKARPFISNQGQRDYWNMMKGKLHAIYENYEIAIPVLENSLKSFPSNPKGVLIHEETVVFLCKSYYELGKYTICLSTLNKELNAMGNAFAWQRIQLLELGVKCNEKLGHPQKALEQLKKAIEIREKALGDEATTHTRVLNRLGEIYQSEKKRKELAKVISLKENNLHKQAIILKLAFGLVGFAFLSLALLAISLFRERKRKREITAVNQQLDGMNTQLKHFANVVSHDLKSPVSAIWSAGMLLERKYSNVWDASAKELIQETNETCERVVNLIDGILNSATSSAASATSQYVDLNLVLKIVSKNLEFEVDASKATIVVDSLPSIWANEAKMIQLFQNLIGNSLKYKAPERNPIIEIKTDVNDRFLLISVTDNGIGFSENNTEDLFEYFVRESKNNMKSGQGIGLGICREIMNAMNGKIWAQNNPLFGATLFIQFPRSM